MSSAPKISMLYKHANSIAQAKIGLEVHAQLKIRSKLFSQGLNSSQALSNSNLDLLDIALPGTLPKLNKRALKAAILSSLGLNCQIQNVIHFDRKNYFYTDMPAGYQITQYNNPIAINGFIDFIVKTHHKSVIAHSQRYDIVKYLYHDDRRSIEELEPYIKRSQIKQIQLEQDSAKTLIHDSSDEQQELCSLVDYNRSGVGLIEIVFEPDLTNHHEAASLVKELTTILKTLDTCDCELQEGSLRVDANVSIRNLNGDEINSSRVELKNLNSLKSLSKGIFYEIQRQTDLLARGENVIQETRTFDTKNNKTIPLRVKEEAVDYRYVPEPSIPPLRIKQNLIDEVKGNMPITMSCGERKVLIEQYGIDLILVAEMMEEPGLCDYLVEIMNLKPDYDANVVADFLIYTISNLQDVSSFSALQVDLLNKSSDFMSIFEPKIMISIFDMMFQDEISFATAYEVLKYIFINKDRSNPREIVEKFDWFQINDRDQISSICLEATKRMKSISKKYAKKGDKSQLRLMLSKLAEITNNKISVKLAIETLNEQLKPPNEKQDTT